MRALPALLFLVPLLLALPAASAQPGGDPLCIIFIEPSEDWRVVRMRADLILDAEERGNLSAEVDADGDGNVTQAEADAWMRASERVHEDWRELGARMLYLDGEPPARVVTSVALKNWTGPVETARNGTVTEHRTYEMQPREDYEHALSGGLYAHPFRIPKPVVEVVVIEAPPGWLVTSVAQDPEEADAEKDSNRTPPTRGYPGGTLFRGANRTVTVSGFDLERSYVVLFRQENPEYPRQGPFAPGFEATLAAAAAALTALAWRGRRRRG